MRMTIPLIMVALTPALAAAQQTGDVVPGGHRLGEPGDEPLLGVITLENLGLVLDPFKRELRPMKLRLG